MSKVTDCARALGQAIVQTDEYKNMQISEQAAMSDPAVTQAMGRFLELKGQLNQAMHDEDSEEIARCSQEMEEVQQQLNSMPALDAMTASRQQFSELMNQVNNILQFMITGELEQSGGCSGNCGSCGGCH